MLNIPEVVTNGRWRWLYASGYRAGYLMLPRLRNSIHQLNSLLWNLVIEYCCCGIIQLSPAAATTILDGELD